MQAHPVLRIAMVKSLCCITLSALLVVLAAAGCAKISKKTGVENRWRDPDVVFQKRVATQQEVLAKLGPPSQIIALKEKKVFYYLFEETKRNLFFLIIYNQANTDVTYDRAIFFFDKDGMLEEYALRTPTIQYDTPYAEVLAALDPPAKLTALPSGFAFLYESAQVF
jgi:outer membrane protein assembly factor BamE (lipoprotein component of BamABCDE complex)